MGVDVVFIISVWDKNFKEWREVATLESGRYYHWRDALDLEGVEGKIGVTFDELERNKKSDIFDGDCMVKETDLYRVMKALAKRHHKYGVRVTWMLG